MGCQHTDKSNVGIRFLTSACASLFGSLILACAEILAAPPECPPGGMPKVLRILATAKNQAQPDRVSIEAVDRVYAEMVRTDSWTGAPRPVYFQNRGASPRTLSSGRRFQQYVEWADLFDTPHSDDLGNQASLLASERCSGFNKVAFV